MVTDCLLFSSTFCLLFQVDICNLSLLFCQFNRHLSFIKVYPVCITVTNIEANWASYNSSMVVAKLVCLLLHSLLNLFCSTIGSRLVQTAVTTDHFHQDRWTRNTSKTHTNIELKGIHDEWNMEKSVLYLDLQHYTIVRTGWGASHC